MKKIILILLVVFAQSSEASVSKFKAYLKYHNQSNPTNIEFDTWYNLYDLIQEGHHVCGLMEAAQRHHINIVIERNPIQSLGSYRFVSDVVARRGAYGCQLQYDQHHGINYSSKPSKYDLEVIHGSTTAPLERLEYPDTIDQDAMFLFPNDIGLQVDLSSPTIAHDHEKIGKLLSKFPRPKW